MTLQTELVALQGAVRLWVEKPLPCPYHASALSERRIPAATRTIQARLVAVELFVHTGGHCPYGLLGAEFTPEATSVLVLRAGATQTAGEPFSEALCGAIDDVRIGLPSDYVESALDGAVEELPGRYLGAGFLRFQWGAHGVVGSSRGQFRFLGRLVAHLLRPDGAVAGTEDLREFVEEMWIRHRFAPPG